MVDLAFVHNRFGLGPRADDRMEGDPKRWLLDQFEAPPSFLSGDLPTLADVARASAEFQQAGKDMKQRRKQGREGDPKQFQEVRAAKRKAIKTQVLQLTEARLDHALVTPRPFASRLVHFWSNHFATSSEMNSMGALPGLLEDGAVRPHIFGKFEDMLLAVTRHPGMLVYLDQFNSLGPNSKVGKRTAERGRDTGLNENLAREILELHTMGVRSGYTQADVIELAKALTGWAIAGFGRGRGDAAAGDAPAGSFVFVQRMHEPGARTLLGQRFAQGGERQAEAMLRWLAIHPATAQHLATKLARHFVADDPPSALVARLEKAYLDSGGDLGAMTRALVDSPEAWAPTSEKFRTPWGWLVASMRAIGIGDAKRNFANGVLEQLGQPTWQVPSPKGWGDTNEDWTGPDALMKRVDVAQVIADKARRKVDARTLAPKILGERLTEATATQIARAESAQTGLAILLASPEMLRR